VFYTSDADTVPFKNLSLKTVSMPSCFHLFQLFILNSPVSIKECPIRIIHLFQ